MPVQLLRVYTIWELVTLRLIKIIRSEKPDITFCSLMYLNSRVIFASKINGCKTVVRCDNSFKSLRFDNKLLIRLSYPFADRIISQTKEMKIEFVSSCKISPCKIEVMQNPVDVNILLEKAEEYNPYTF